MTLLPDLPQQLVVFLLGAFSVAGVLIAIAPALRRQNPYQMRFASIAESSTAVLVPEKREGGRRKRSIDETLREIEEKQKAQTKKKSARPTLVRRMRQADISWSKRTYVIVCLLVGLFSGQLFVFFGFSLLVATGFGLAGGLLLPHLFVNFRCSRRRKQFSNAFPGAVDVIVRGIKSGLPLVDCLKMIASEAPEPVRGEFKLVIEDQTIGLPIAEAVERMSERMQMPEVNFFAIVIAIQSRTGGNLSEVLANLSKVLRDRKQMEAKIRAMSQEAKTSGAIIAALPFFVCAITYFTSPDFIGLLFTETTGNILLAGCGVWMTFGVLVMRKMISFDF
ncbi:type II secretion system F family protein [Jiella marina]|uniref:type II secretion system F family protein n=1 Tax=Jiella sp. LLJ827 TaxID=2917712 RepID=UPI0021012791|nr:type II secretion system F family protein [Jiella sp. LLJ827]MCQ0989318.1 type II secretion system F family protein [Jiella sp. LLJ827]